MTIVEHFEYFLGPILHGWKCDPAGRTLPFQVAQYEGVDPDYWSSFSTIGLSHCPLNSRVSAKAIRQELLLTVGEKRSKLGITGVLQQVAMEMLDSRNALLRGDVVGPRDSLVSGSHMEALFVSPPVYFPDSFAYFDDGLDSSVVIAWLVPISRSEANYVAKYGWRKFEDRLLEYDPDITDLMRVPIVE